MCHKMFNNAADSCYSYLYLKKYNLKLICVKEIDFIP